jgi:chromosome segregation ATPase
VVETLMLVALGALIATFLALMALPALNRRAERLARRRLSSLFPLSIAELNADKDGMRAEFAVTQRLLEREIEAVRATNAKIREEAGRHIVAIKGHLDHIAALDATLAARDTEIAGLKDVLAATRTELAATQVNLAATGQELAQRQEDLAVRIQELVRAQADIDSRRVAMADLDLRLMAATTRGEELSRAIDDAGRELAARQIALDALHERAEGERQHAEALADRARHLDEQREALTKKLASRDVEAAGLMAQLADAAHLAGKRDEALALLEHDMHRMSAALEAAQAELSGSAAERQRREHELMQRNEDLKAEVSALHAALDQARADRARLKQELATRDEAGDGDATRVLIDQIVTLSEQIAERAGVTLPPRAHGEHASGTLPTAQAAPLPPSPRAAALRGTGRTRVRRTSAPPAAGE